MTNPKNDFISKQKINEKNKQKIFQFRIWFIISLDCHWHEMEIVYNLYQTHSLSAQSTSIQYSIKFNYNYKKKRRQKENIITLLMIKTNKNKRAILLTNQKKNENLTLYKNLKHRNKHIVCVVVLSFKRKKIIVWNNIIKLYLAHTIIF